MKVTFTLAVAIVVEAVRKYDHPMRCQAMYMKWLMRAGIVDMNLVRLGLSRADSTRCRWVSGGQSGMDIR